MSPQKRTQIKMLNSQATYPASDTKKFAAAHHQQNSSTVTGFSLGALQPLTNLPEKTQIQTKSTHESPVKLVKTMRKSISEKSVKPRFNATQPSSQQ
jgi:hypothetical protein|mmetsp:Transcript_15549/g.21074  ORF Transcript_15549/g.21074 Transcript_15549/m.21074 type:complete len:97 (-) Transcript_15549:1397-1687(-)